MLTGLNTKQSVAVTFHCILPKPLWQWNKKSRMYMRFEGYALGNWENDVGEFKEGRYVTSCVISIKLDFLNLQTYGRRCSGDDLHTER